MSTSAKKIVLRSSDGRIFQVEETVALQSQTIADVVKDDSVGNEIRIANVTGDILETVIEFCKKHVGVVVVSDGDSSSSSSSEEELKKWDTDFMSKTDRATLFHLLRAAHYLKIKNLCDLTSQTVTDGMNACNSVEELLAFFNTENDFTPEEEAKLRQENP